MTLIWSPSSLPASVRGCTWRPDDSGWGCVSLWYFWGKGKYEEKEGEEGWGEGDGEKYTACGFGDFLHEFFHLLGCHFLLLKKDDTTL